MVERISAAVRIGASIKGSPGQRGRADMVLELLERIAGTRSGLNSPENEGVAWGESPAVVMFDEDEDEDDDGGEGEFGGDDLEEDEDFIEDDEDFLDDDEEEELEGGEDFDDDDDDL
jgi:hypothetical protein